MTAAENLGTCRWCGYDRPDHEEGCPVRQLAEGMAETMAARPGAVTEFHIDGATIGWDGIVWAVDQTRDDCSWQRGSAETRIVERCGCGTHIGEPMILIATEQEG